MSARLWLVVLGNTDQYIIEANSDTQAVEIACARVDDDVTDVYVEGLA